jgi:lipid-binding SYLF domain-containing protein
MPIVSLQCKPFLLLVCTLFITLSPFQAKSEVTTKYQQVIDKSSDLIQSFSADPNLSWMKNNIKQARAVFILPKLTKSGFIATVAGGTGVLLARNTRSNTWSYPAFYTLGKLSLNLHFGTDRSEIILLVMNLKGLKALLQPACKLGTDVTLAAGPIAAVHDTEAKKADILFFRRSIDSSDPIDIHGDIIAPRKKWNNRYYKKPVDADDILLRNSVTDEAADKLREQLSKTDSL